LAQVALAELFPINQKAQTAAILYLAQSPLMVVAKVALKGKAQVELELAPEEQEALAGEALICRLEALAIRQALLHHKAMPAAQQHPAHRHLLLAAVAVVEQVKWAPMELGLWVAAKVATAQHLQFQALLLPMQAVVGVAFTMQAALRELAELVVVEMLELLAHQTDQRVVMVV
jgi:hypothetical protein